METKKNFFASIGDKIKAYFAKLKQRNEAFKLLSGKDQRRWWTNKILDNGIYIFVLCFIIYTAIKVPTFLGTASLVNILKQTTAYLPIALGIAGCIVLAGTDLSAGRIVGLTAAVSASLLQSSDYASKMWPELGTFSIVVTLLIALCIGLVVGLVNGFFIAKFSVHPFIVTLATQLMTYGALLAYLGMGTNGGQAISGLTSSYTSLVSGTMFKIGTVSVPWYCLYGILATVFVWFLWTKTKFGKNMFAVGANKEAAKVSGVNVMLTIIIVSAFAGLMYGYTGFIEAARNQTASATTGFNYEADAIAAVVIGGVSFSGGVGTIGGVILGVFLLRVIYIGLTLLGVSSDMFFIIKGAIILAACTLDMRKYAVKR